MVHCENWSKASRILWQYFFIYDMTMNVKWVWCLLKGTQLWWRVWLECQGTCTRSGPVQLQWTPTTHRLCTSPTHSRVTTKQTCHNGTACVLIGYIYNVNFLHTFSFLHVVTLKIYHTAKKKENLYVLSRNLKCVIYTSCWVLGYFETFL